MNIRKHFTIGLALLIVALGFATVPAHAESVLKGTFELPAATYWGNTLLQPGHYTILMSTEAHDIGRVPTLRVSGEGVNASFLAVAKPVAESGRNYLEVVNIDGTYVVRAFDAGLLGESFAFGVTKNVTNKALRASSEPAIAIPVAAE